MKFRKRPVTVEAIHVSTVLRDAVHDWRALPKWIRDAYDDTTPGRGLVFTKDRVLIITLEGTMWADRGDWIVRGVGGELYPVKGDIFAETYEPADDVASAKDASMGGAPWPLL